jgi:DNA-binding Lrp family transcriptional regulator
MNGKNRENLKILDEKDKQILEILQQNSREKLTNIARKIGLSIDSVKKRIDKMVEKGILVFQALIDPRKIGFSFILSTTVKLHNITKEEFDSFINYLRTHPRVIELFTMAGDYDVAFVIIARNTEELENLQMDIRQKFNKIIADWRSALSLKVYKFEEYRFL